MSETGVIVVGAGVVGSTLACLLGQSGLDVTLVEARPLPGDEGAVVRDPLEIQQFVRLELVLNQ